MAQDSGYFNLFSSESSVPDANELLSLKILKDANGPAFEHLAKEETKWLSASLGLLKSDPYLQVQMGGSGIRQALKLSSLLKQRAEQVHFNQRTQKLVEDMVDNKFMTSGWEGLKPNIKSSPIIFKGDGDIDVLMGQKNKAYSYGGSNSEKIINQQQQIIDLNNRNANQDFGSGSV